MDLVSGTPYWMTIDSRPPEYQPLSNDISCDIAIIGGGITGALAAYHLTQAGIEALILDRRHLCQGSTSASTGLLQYEIDTPLVELSSRLGRSWASRAYKLCEETLHKFIALDQEFPTPTRLSRKQSLYLANDPSEIPSFHEECAARHAAGISVEFLSQGQLKEQFAITRPAALLSPLALQVDPYLLSKHLIAASIARGMKAFPHTQVTSYHATGSHVTLTTAGGAQVRARRVIFATGYETPTFLSVKTRLRTTFALATQPISFGHPVLNDHLLWESAHPYLYVRSTSDGRAIIGGEDIPMMEGHIPAPLIQQKSHVLMQKFSTLFPQVTTYPAVTWAGTFAETPDGLPYIGSCTQFPLGFFALGYGGNGITFSLIAAEIIRDLFLGRKNPDAELFRFDR